MTNRPASLSFYKNGHPKKLIRFQSSKFPQFEQATNLISIQDFKILIYPAGSSTDAPMTRFSNFDIDFSRRRLQTAGVRTVHTTMQWGREKAYTYKKPAAAVGKNTFMKCEHYYSNITAQERVGVQPRPRTQTSNKAAAARL